MTIDKLKASCGKRYESRCVDYEGTISPSSALYTESYVTLHDVAEDLYTRTDSLLTSISGLATLNSPTFTGTIGGLTKTTVGLNLVDNTTDLSKPISTLTQLALDTKVDKIENYSLVSDSEISRLALVQNYIHPTYAPIDFTTTNLQVIDRITVNSIGAITSLTWKNFDAASYTHPLSHPASMVIETTTKRFVTDAQIALWNTIGSGSGGGLSTADVQAIVEAYGYVTLAEIPGIGTGDLNIIGDITATGDITAYATP